MNRREKELAWVAYATLYTERFGFSVIPIGEDKRPAVAWKEYQDRRPSLKELVDWPHDGLAIVTGPISGIVVVDCDSEDDALWFWNNVAKSPAVVKTRRGRHFYFRHPGQYVMSGTKINGHYDVKGDRSYVLAPPSLHSEGRYHWRHKLTSVADLPVFDPAWRPETKFSQPGRERLISDGAKYIDSIRSVAGQGGDKDAYRAAMALRDSGMSEAEAFVALQHWNRDHADPNWTDKELLHKVCCAFRD